MQDGTHDDPTSLVSRAILLVMGGKPYIRGIQVKIGGMLAMLPIGGLDDTLV